MPLIALLKLIALGSIKLIFLLFGIAFFPIYALRLILGGATGLLLPTLAWLVDNGRLDATRHDAIVADLVELIQVEVTRKEARHLLWELIKKTLSNFKNSVVYGVTRTGQFITKFIG